MTLLNKACQQYLARYAEPEQKLLKIELFRQLKVDHVLVIPAYKESVEFIQRLIAQSFDQLTLLTVLVVNQPETEPDTSPQQALLHYLQGNGELIWQKQELTLFQCSEQRWFLVVDRYTQPIPSKQGVGLARKIGADIALTLITHGLVNSPWICSTDADTHLPENYFSVLPTNPNTFAAVYDFEHRSDNFKLHQANQWYEQALRYYVRGLTFAGSRYNFFTIGSVISFTGDAYAKVRGFPKRSAAEDFYLLNKLAKIGDIQSINEAKLIIEARESDRVPFGTGPSVAKILAMQQPEYEYLYYHPQVFYALKNVLQHFEQLPEQLDCWQQWLAQLPHISQQALLSLGFEKFIEKQQSSSAKQISYQLMQWFDGFKTLKFIHSIKQQGFADIPLAQALQQAEF